MTIHVSSDFGMCSTAKVDERPAVYYFSSMKVKTSITLSPEVLSELDSLAHAAGSRSAVVETALRAYFSARQRKSRDRRDFSLINANADQLNEEAVDVLGYQIDL